MQKQLGHSSVTTTTVYADVLLEETLEAVNGLYEDDDFEVNKSATDLPSDHSTAPDPEKSRN